MLATRAKTMTDKGENGASDILSRLSQDEIDLLDDIEQAGFVAPMLATLTHETFSDDAWIYERKLDGERVEAVVHEGRAVLFSRNGNDISASYPEIVDAMSRSAETVTVDGEIVAFEGSRTSFARLQPRIHRSGKESDIKVYYYVFDILRLADKDLQRLPLRRRKAILKSALVFEDPIRYTAHRNREGEAWFKRACEKGWEGLIAKRASSVYVSKRSRDWLKFKCDCRQEFVIAGYTDPHGQREGFGALLLGVYEEQSLHYAGRVGTGFDHEFLLRFAEELEAKQTDEPAFVDPPDDDGVHWVKPEFVGEVAFTEWTDANKLRHPRFIGLRRDKAPNEIVREDKRG